LPENEVEKLTDDIIGALKTVYDPEIPADIYELGLIYRVDIEDDRSVKIDMTLTAPACPVAGEMPKWVQDAVEAVPGVRLVNDETRLVPEAKPFVWSAERDVVRVTLGGNAPLPASKGKLLDAAHADLGGVEVVDQMALARGAPQHFEDAATLLIGQIGKLKEGLTTVGEIVRVTMPSRSRPRSVRVSICCEIPAVLRLMSLNRREPSRNSMTTSMLHFSPMRARIWLTFWQSWCSGWDIVAVISVCLGDANLRSCDVGMVTYFVQVTHFD